MDHSTHMRRWHLAFEAGFYHQLDCPVTLDIPRRAGEVDVVLAGGVNIITDPDNYAGLGNAYFLSKT